ncbi:Type VII secretion system accessory factor EsaB [Bacillus rhizoplanae]|uniref:Type VII secretion system accessory factor EsaB n=1 Tax=Bacillus rhizoplanae TaxID=2880966 RepID=A0ABN8A4B0_9BACI|nr:EsaB/YukD family protein [Bacillus rhizoplanae]CAG9614494.1 Type VII secretion system accessory factor EsaB [Bacillus rhizoplanae]
MAVQTHINVSVDFSKWNGETYDLRIPNHQSIKYLLKNLIETLKIQTHDGSHYVIKVVNKSLLLTDNDRLIDYEVTDGDILQVL